MHLRATPPQEAPTLALRINIYLLIIIATIEFAFSASTLSWLHDIKSEGLGFVIMQNSNSSTNASTAQHSQRATKLIHVLLATPEKLLLTHLRAGAAASFIACIFIGLSGLYVLRLRSQLLLGPLQEDADNSSNNDANGNNEGTISSVPYQPVSPSPAGVSPSSSVGSPPPPVAAKSRMSRIRTEAYHRMPAPLRAFFPRPRSFTVIRATHNTTAPGQASNLSPSATDTTNNATNTNGSGNTITEANANLPFPRPNHPGNHYYATHNNMSQRAKRHGRHRQYYRFWVFLHIPAIILTLGVVAYSIPASRSPQGTVDVETVIRNGASARYPSPPPPPPPPSKNSSAFTVHSAGKSKPPPGVWTPKGWLEAVLRLGPDLSGMAKPDSSTFKVSSRSLDGDDDGEQLRMRGYNSDGDDDNDDDSKDDKKKKKKKKGDDRWRLTLHKNELMELMARQMKILGGWELLLTALAVAQGVETITALWEARRWKKQVRLMEGDNPLGASGTGGYSF